MNPEVYAMAAEPDYACYRFLFEHAPIPIGEFDFSFVRSYLDKLEGVEGGTEAFFGVNPEDLFLCLSQATVLDLNRSARRALGTEGSLEDAVNRLAALISGPLLRLAARALLGFRKGEFACEYDLADLGGITTAREHGTIYLLAPAAPSSWELVFITAVDATREHGLEMELAANERRYRRVFDHLRDLYIETDAEGRIREVSPSVREVLGYERSELLGRPMSTLYEKPEDRAVFVELLTRKGQVTEFKARFRRGSGECIACSVNAAREPAEDGSSFCVFDSIRDITESVRQADELRRLAEGKALLFHELQHRVKNNLAILASLIDLQMSESEEESIRDALASIATRVHSIAKAHEMLLPASKAGPLLDLREYLSAVLANVCALFDEGGELVRRKVKGCAFRFDVDTSMRVGLVVNELALNSLKHAFFRAPCSPEMARRGESRACGGQDPRPMIVLRLEMLEDGSCGLFFGDNGSGLPDGFDFEHCKGLGHLLIEALTCQLDGRFTVLGSVDGIMEPEATGARFELVFPAATAAI